MAGALPALTAPESDDAPSSAASVERVVKGGATMYPRLPDPRPAPLKPLSEHLLTFLTSAARGGLIGTLVTFALQRPFLRIVNAYLAKGYSAESFFRMASNGVHIITYLVMFAFFETLERFQWLQAYKLARTPAQEPSWKQKVKALKDFALAQILNYPLAGLVLFRGMQWWGAPSINSPLPSFAKVWAQFALAYLINETMFSWVHRLFHSALLYKHFHKKHHEFVGTVSIAAENASPVEQLVANLVPTFLGMFLFKAHPLTVLVWEVWRLSGTYETHSGYAFYGTLLHKIGLTNASGACYHDAHHVLNQGNFGNEFWDGVFNTKDAWLALGGADGYFARAQASHVASSAPLLGEKTRKERVV